MAMPNIESEFQNKDIIAQQFVDMNDAICFLATALNVVAAHGKENPVMARYAKETLEALPAIFVPMTFRILKPPAPQ